MSKQQSIQDITSYLGDGFIQIPAQAPSTFSFNDVGIEDLRRWIETLKTSLEALNQSQYLTVIPEGLLNSIKSGLEQARNAASLITSGDVNSQNNYNNLVAQVENLITTVAPYLNIADINNYKDLQNKAQALIDSTNDEIAKQKQQNQRLNSGISRISQKADSLLGKVDSGVLNKELDDLSKSKWHIGILIISVLAAAWMTWILIGRSQDFTDAIIKYVGNPNIKINWAVYIAKWVASLPYIIILIFALVESRRRISLIDQFVFRSRVAKSLEGYRLLLLADQDQFVGEKEKDQSRLQVSQFMIMAILELINQPSKKERSSIALRFKDLFEVKADSE